MLKTMTCYLFTTNPEVKHICPHSQPMYSKRPAARPHTLPSTYPCMIDAGQRHSPWSSRSVLGGRPWPAGAAHQADTPVQRQQLIPPVMAVNW